jgi:hypothetical protein
MTPFIRESVRWFASAGVDPTELAWFDVSSVLDARGDDQYKQNDWLIDYRPPFDRNIIIGKAARNGKAYKLFVTVVGTDPLEGIVFNSWVSTNGGAPKSSPLYLYCVDGDVVRYGPCSGEAIMSEHDVRWSIGLIALWYESLAAHSAQAHVPSVKRGITSDRLIKKGRPPLYDWRTVIVQPIKPVKREHLGGTHASPRQHDRRGHMRMLPGGKQVWVKPCRVGDASRGTVFHDYEVRA